MLSAILFSVVLAFSLSGIGQTASIKSSLPDAPVELHGKNESFMPMSSGLPTNWYEDFMLFQTLLEKGEWHDLDARCSMALAKNPASAELLYMKAYALFREGKAQDSLDAYTAAAKLRHPGEPDLMAVGADYSILADYEDADRWFTRATEWKPEDPLAW